MTVGVSAAGNQRLQLIHHHQLDVLVIDHDPALLLELGQRAADGFQFQTQEAADFLAAHAQDEIIGGRSRGVDRRWDKLSRKAARRSSAFMLPNSNITF